LRRSRRLVGSANASHVAAIASAVAVYVVSGLFVNLFKAEVAIWLAAMIAALHNSSAVGSSGGNRSSFRDRHAHDPSNASSGRGKGAIATYLT
jgi:hypothetical protein